MRATRRLPERIRLLRARVSDLFRRLVGLASLRGRTAGSTGLRIALAVVGEGPIREALEDVFRAGRWRLVVTDSIPSAMVQYNNDPAPIILLEREAQPDWREMVALLARLSPRPYVILLSPQSDKNLWDELTQCGGSDILRTPLNPESVVRAVRSAWTVWRTEQILRHQTAAHP